MTDLYRDYEVRLEGPPFPPLSPMQGEQHDQFLRRIADCFEQWVNQQRPVLVPRVPPQHQCVFHAPDRDYYGIEAIEQYAKWRKENG